MTGSLGSAFVLGAGLGTRLRPLTDELPKPLVPIFGKPLITFAIDHLLSVGLDRFVINTHHLAPAFEEVFAGRSYRERPVELVFEPILLETGGGIKNAQPWLGEKPFIVYSGDVLTDVDLSRLIDDHFRNGNDVTMALRKTGLSSSIALENGRVVDIRGKQGVDGGYDFANISIWNPSIFAKIPTAQKVSFVPILIEWIKAGAKVGGVVLDDHGWFNIGSPSQYLETHRTIFQGEWRPSYLADWPEPVSSGATIHEGVILEGFHSIGQGAEIGAGARLRDCVVWPGTKIAAGAKLESCIVTPGRHAEGACHHANL